MTVSRAGLHQPDETRYAGQDDRRAGERGGRSIGRYTFQPGWRWSECIKPVVGTDSCQVEHIGYFLSCRLQRDPRDGSEAEVGAGEVYRIAPATILGRGR